MALWPSLGAPIAHEDHALRACYAALAMQAAMQRYAEEVRRRTAVGLRIRVGLNAGEVVVRAIGNDLHMDYSAVGQTVHLAARMEQLAPPGSILLTAATLRLVEGLVRVNRPGAAPGQGLTGARGGVRAGRDERHPRRLQAAAARGLTRFVGRQTELAALHAGAGAGWGGARPGGGAGGRGRGWQVPPGLRVRPFPPHPGLAGAGERLGVLWQGHALFPGG